MINLHTNKACNGSNFGWLIRQMSINQKKWAADVSQKGCIRLSFLFSFRLARRNVFFFFNLRTEEKTEPDLRLHIFESAKKERKPTQT